MTPIKTPDGKVSKFVGVQVRSCCDGLVAAVRAMNGSALMQAFCWELVRLVGYLDHR
jgi:hypothetical protein